MLSLATEIWESPVGDLYLGAMQGQLSHVLYAAGGGETLWCAGDPSIRDEPVIMEAIEQLAEYFEGTRQVFDLPLVPPRTPFQQEVRRELLRIPYGDVISYGELARRIGKPRAVRAVGAANAHNPLSIIVPCHRVVGADGSLTGYSGGLEVKGRLLGLEHLVVSPNIDTSGQQATLEF